jgi:hypothetical protein
MPTTQPHRISATMAIDALREQCIATEEAKANYKRQLALRDDLIRDCRAVKVPERSLVSITGLGRDSIHRIAHSASKTYQ